MLCLPFIWILAILSFPLAEILNPAMKMLLPVIEPLYAYILRLFAPMSARLSRSMVERVIHTDPKLFEG
jgi:hypothetical protein